MKCSIIIAVLDSHEIFRRQMLRFEKILPDDFELIIVDDGSDTPLQYQAADGFPFKLLHTGDKRPWTQHKARNIGASIARGEYLLMTDIDHILTSDALTGVSRFQGDMLKFRRQVAQLDENGEICGVGASLHSHVNTFAIRSELYSSIGGYDAELTGYGTDRVFRNKCQRLVERGAAKSIELGAVIYVITQQKWFHKLKRNRPSD